MATTISDRLLRSLAPKREVGAHKGGVGGLLVLAGSPQYPGASWLVCRCAGRNGAGIVYLAAPRMVVGLMASSMPEVAFVPLPETESAGSARHAMERITDKLDRVNAIVIGPGLGDDDSTNHLLSAIFGFGGGTGRSLSGFGFGAESARFDEADTIFGLTDAHIVVDADGLNWLAKQPKWWERVPANRLVLTPHPAEANRLCGKPIDSIVNDPAGTAAELAESWNQTVVIKSGFTAAADGSAVVISDLAPTALATAGTGDCFAGAIGAFLAQGCSSIDAVTLAIGIGSRAASRLQTSFGPAGVLSTDMPDTMAIVLNDLIKEDDQEDS